MRRVKHTLVVLLIVVIGASACSAQSTQTAQPTQIIEPASTQAPANLPRTEAEVPRVSVQEAKAAFDSGEAIIVDVRSDSSYEASHIAGSTNVQLGEIETNPTGLPLEKDQWIITYCT